MIRNCQKFMGCNFAIILYLSVWKEGEVGMSNPEIFDYVQIAEFQIGTPCICCGEIVILNEEEAHGVCFKLCDGCKEAILFAKEMKTSKVAKRND